MMLNRQDVWIVIASYNEGPRIRRTLDELKAEGYANIIVVDDGSSDGSCDFGNGDVWCLRHPVNRGQGAALQTGIEFFLGREGKFIVTYDADEQHCPHEVENLVNPLLQGKADVAFGSRFLGKHRGMPVSKWLILKAAVHATRLILRIRITDTHNGLRAFTREAAASIRITKRRMAHASEIIYKVHRLGLRFVEVPVTVNYFKEDLRKGQGFVDAFKVLFELLLPGRQ